MSPKLRAYVAAVGVAAAVLLALYVPRDLETMWPHYMAWVAICALSESMWLTTLSGAGTSSMASTAGLAAIILWGQGPGMWIAALSSLLAELIVQRKPWVRATFNASQITITHWVAAGAFALLGGPINGVHALTTLPAGFDSAARLALPILGLFVGYLLVNRALVAVAVSWSTERRFLRVLREDWFFADKLLADAASFLLSPLMVVSFRAIDYIGVLLFYAPLWMIHESTRRYNELQNAQQHMLRSERMAARGEMAADIGHEMRNRLVPVKGQVQLLMREAAKGNFDNVNNRAQHILEAANLMETMSRGLMEFTRAELTIERFNMNQLIAKTIEFVRTQNRFDGVEWDLRLAEPAPELRGDPGQLQQVLINLFVNAADAMNERPVPRKVIRVTSLLEQATRRVRVVVHDSGAGIVASNLPRIFESHFTTKPTGHGIGLATSKRIIVNHGGKMTVESPPGDGAMFTIDLPQDKDGSWGSR